MANQTHVRSQDSARAKRIERPRKLKWRHHIAAFFIFACLRLLSWTWRMRLVDAHDTFRIPLGPVIFCMWHNRLALAMRCWERFGIPNTRSTGLVGLISASHDGGVLARAVKYFKVEAVRGSSSRRGAQALLELTSWAEKGYSVAITPDGPRGPRYRVQDGIFALAQLNALPILPVSTFVHWKFCLKSWDRFQVPLPFSVCEVRIGQPVVVDREITETDRANIKRDLEAQMHALTRD